MIRTDHNPTRNLQQAFVRSSVCVLVEETVEDRPVFGIHLARRHLVLKLEKNKAFVLFAGKGIVPLSECL